ncbi:MAG: hypothetical protein AAFY26_23895 [Cyanobacteria bacterium J06638_22]
MIKDIFHQLDQLGLALSAEEIADALWLGIQMRRASPDGDQGFTETDSETQPRPASPTRQKILTGVEQDQSNFGSKAYLSSRHSAG